MKLSWICIGIKIIKENIKSSFYVDKCIHANLFTTDIINNNSFNQPLKYSYDLTKNIPIIISTNFNSKFSNVFILFSNEPTIINNIDNSQITSNYFENNLNRYNNLPNIDSIYRCIFDHNSWIINQ